MADAQHLPHGRCRAGDRHLKFYETRDNLLRASFNEVAELYDQARPTYPQEFANSLVALCDIGPDSRVLEIGPGTGS